MVAVSASTATATCRWSKSDELVGLVSMRDLVRIAQIRPVEGTLHRRARGLEGRRRHRDRNRRRARPRRLLPLPPVLGDRPGRAAPARGRVAPAVRGRAPDDRRRAGRVRRRDPAAARDPRPTSPPCCRRSRTAGEHFTPLDALRTAVSLTAASEGFQPCLDIDQPDAARQRHADQRAGAHVRHRALPAAPRRRSRSTPHPELRLRGELPLHAHRRGAGARARAGDRAVPDLDDRPRLQRLDVHRAGRGLDRRRPRRGGRRRHRRTVRPAARRRAEPGARHARRDRHPDNADAWIRNAVERGERIMGFGHAVYKTDDPRSLMLRGVAERIGADSGLVEFAKQRRAHGRRRARRAEARARSSTPTSSSTPAS